MKTPVIRFFPGGLALLRRGLALAFCTTLAWLPSIATAAIEPLTLDGAHFVDSAGTPVRFWSMNLAAFYPTHAQAEAVAANLAAREINLVRLHHDLRSSLDWNTVSGIPALVTYVNDTRTSHVEAWDRFDYFNAQLRARGIRILLSLHGTRRFLPGDVDILTTDPTDRTNWMNGVTAINAMPSNLDLYKMLPALDERSAQLMEEFAQHLLTHVNPYTGIAYGNDPQVLYLETMNETSSEYAIVAGNKFQSSTQPAVSYWSTLLQTKWDAYTAAHGITPNDIYVAGTNDQRIARSEFLRGLDEAYFNRIKTFVRNLGCQTPIEFSNLWRGDAFQKMEESLSDVVEEHDYDDPLVPRTFNDLFNYFSRSTPVGKPYFVGELNQGQTDALINANAPYRTLLQLATSAYGSFNDWTGVAWFAWAHGDKMLGNDGWSIWEERRPVVNSDLIGQIDSDGMMLDHLRTAGILFKRGLVAPSSAPLTWFADEPVAGLNYQQMMTPKYQYQAGWQNIHAVKRAFGLVPPSQPTAPWMTTAPTNPLVSDTGEINKDVTRQQLTVVAPQAEAFGGKLDGQAPAGLTHLGVTGSSGSATVILVADDGQSLSTSENLIISRTQLDSANAEVAAPVTTLSQLKAPTGNFAWYIKRTRPRGETGYEALTFSGGGLALPTDGWHEAELKYAAAGSLPPRQSTTQTGDALRVIFDDGFRIAGVLGPAQGGFSFNAQQVIDPATVLAPAEGIKSDRMKFTAGFDPCVVGINFLNSINQATTLDFAASKATTGLRFWVYTKRNVSSFSVELASDNGGQVVETRLPLSNYLQASDYGNKWVEVTVPFSDFSDTGIHYDSATGQTAQMAFVWSKVKGVGFYCSTVTSGYYDPYYDNLRVIRVGAAEAVPAAPTGLTATAGIGQIALSWIAPTGATGYTVKRGGASGGPYATIGNPTSPEYADTTVTAGATYYYVVSATNATGEGPNSAEVSTAPQGVPAAPTAVTATSGDAEVNLSWAASTGATSYNVKRTAVSGGPYVTVGSPAASNYTDETVSNGTTYYYVISAVNAAGESTASAQASATPQGSAGTTTNAFISVGAEDGFVQESSQTSNVGGGFNAATANGQALIIGDTNSNRQNKLIVSFDTSSIPAGATIVSATLKLRRGALVGGNPFATLGSCYADIKGGTGFGDSTALAAGDFQAAADATQVATMSNPVNDGDWSIGALNATGLTKIDRAGTTQLRVYFSLGDNGNGSNDYMGFYSSENSIVSNHPVLEVLYQSSSVVAAPAITSASTATGTYDAPLVYVITASNAPTSFSATGLPAGLTLDATSGKISGSPSAAGNYVITLEATNSSGTGTASLALVVAKAETVVTLGDLNSSYDGTAKSASAAAEPSGLAFQITYNGYSARPINAGNYGVVASVDDPNFTGSASGTLVIAKAPAAITLENVSQIYDGSPKFLTATTAPVGLPVVISYNGSAGAPIDAGAYSASAMIVDGNYFGSATGTLNVDRATATISLQGLHQRYDGTPKTVTSTTIPTGLTVTIAYDGNSQPPTIPGVHTVAATIDSGNYTASVSNSLFIGVTALVRHAPVLNGGLDGSAEVLSPETITLNRSAWISGDLLVPGTPAVKLNGSASYGGLIDGEGSAVPSGYSVVLNGSAVLRHVVQHIDPIALAPIGTPPAPSGSRDVVLNNPNQNAGDFATLRNLTLNASAGSISVPPGSYGHFTANGNSGFVLGVAGSIEPAIYTLQNLTLNSSGSLRVLSPVIFTINDAPTLSGAIGDVNNPDWLTLLLHAGNFTLNSNATFNGYVVAPASNVILNGNSTVTGGITANGLTINSDALLSEVKL